MNLPIGRLKPTVVDKWNIQSGHLIATASDRPRFYFSVSEIDHLGKTCICLIELGDTARGTHWEVLGVGGPFLDFGSVKLTYHCDAQSLQPKPNQTRGAINITTEGASLFVTRAAASDRANLESLLPISSDVLVPITPLTSTTFSVKSGCVGILFEDDLIILDVELCGPAS
jgi:hypothetical protein